MRKLTWILVFLLSSPVLGAKPRVAVFPLSGSAAESERQRAGLAIRTKLDRQGVYEPIDGPTMSELSAGKAIDFTTSANQLIELSREEKPEVLIWGQLDTQLKLHLLDQRLENAKPSEFIADIAQPTDLRFAVEKLIETLPGSKASEHPSEVAVVRDYQAEKLWETNPNLMPDGKFDRAGDWRALLRKDKYAPSIINRAPNADEVVIRKTESGEQHLAMNLSRDVAESNGLACLSGIIKIEPKTRYRIQFRYQSDGPVLRPFVKGYVVRDGAEREIYRRQVPTQEKSDGKWVEVVDELNPQHTTFTVEYLRVDIYAYLHPGTVLVDDVIIKAVGEQTRVAKDEALDKKPE